MMQAPRRAGRTRRSDQLPGTGDDRPIRQDLVRQVRAMILAGEYDSSAKIEAAADRLAGTLDFGA